MKVICQLLERSKLQNTKTKVLAIVICAPKRCGPRERTDDVIRLSLWGEPQKFNHVNIGSFHLTSAAIEFNDLGSWIIL